jgi:hypothetical protein
MWFWPVVSAMEAPQFRNESSKCEDQPVQGSSGSCTFRSDWCRCWTPLLTGHGSHTGLQQCPYLSASWPWLFVIYLTNSVALVRNRTIPTERPPLVGEDSANFWEQRVSHDQRNGSPRPYSRFPRPDYIYIYIYISFPAISVCVRFCTADFCSNILILTY